MNGTTLIIIIMSSHSSHNIKQTMQNYQLVFSGFDCRAPKKVVPFFTKVWCQPEKTGDENALGEKELLPYCTKGVSKFLVYCNSYSHMKVWASKGLGTLSYIHRRVYKHVPKRAYRYNGQTIKDRTQHYCVNSDDSTWFNQS